LRASEPTPKRKASHRGHRGHRGGWEIDGLNVLSELPGFKARNTPKRKASHRGHRGGSEIDGLNVSSELRGFKARNMPKESIARRSRKPQGDWRLEIGD
jgi:hypothetical protein